MANFQMAIGEFEEDKSRYDKICFRGLEMWEVKLKNTCFLFKRLSDEAARR